MKRRQREWLTQNLDVLYRFAAGLTRDQESAKDLVQQCCLKALAAKSVPDDAPAMRFWLLRIMRNTWIDTLRRNNRDLLSYRDELPDAVEYSSSSARLINELTVRMALEKLQPVQREIIAAVDLLGLSYSEASEVLEVPIGTVMSRLSRARGALLRTIGDTDEQTAGAVVLKVVK